MKILTIAMTLLLATAAFGEIPNPAEYTVAVRVVSSRIVLGTNSQSQDLTVVINGKRFELYGGAPHLDLLRVGEYKAKLLKLDESRPYEYRWVYQFLFSDGKIRDYFLVGEGE